MNDEVALLRSELSNAKAELLAEHSARIAAEEVNTATIAQMQRAVTELEQFAYITSHDLQAPLRNITGFSQLLAKRLGADLPADAKDYLGYIQSSVRQMQTLIDDLLTFSRVGRSPQPEMKALPLSNTLDRAVAQLAARIQASGGEVVIQSLPTVEADHKMLTQLFTNLIDNALKFQPPGNKPRVEVSAVQEHGQWLVTVSDNGIGIPEAHLEDIFAVFRRLHTQEEYEGTGIGLAICRKAAGFHSADLWAESDGPNKGARFILRLPARLTPA